MITWNIQMEKTTCIYFETTREFLFVFFSMDLTSMANTNWTIFHIKISILHYVHPNSTFLVEYHFQLLDIFMFEIYKSLNILIYLICLCPLDTYQI